MREDVVPYVVSCIFLGSCLVLVGAYGLFRKFNVKKTTYGFYGEGGPPEGSGGGEAFGEAYEAHEMDAVADASTTRPQTNGRNGSVDPAEAAPEAAVPAAAAPATNPFKNKAAAGSNPFGQYGSAQ